VSVEGSSHLGPDEAIKRQNAELLQADVYDVVLLLVGAYVNKILPPLLPHFPYALPPDVVAHHLGKLGIVQDTIMTWANEALERAGVPQPQRPAGKAGPVFDFDGLVELGHGDAKVRAGLENAEMMVRFAGQQLAAISPDDPAARKHASQALNRAISLLLEASARLMQLDAVHAAAPEPFESPRLASRYVFAARLDEAIQVPEAEAIPGPKLGIVGIDTRDALGMLDPTDDTRDALDAQRRAAGIELERQLAQMEAERQQPVNPEALRPAQGGVAPTPYLCGDPRSTGIG
jgi:hypothetical protein